MSLSNLHFNGSCPLPFLDESLWPATGGYIRGRYCAQNYLLPGGSDQCCLPCPATDLLYPDNFYQQTRAAGSINIGAFVLCVFMALSYVFLPAEKTRRHYLNVWALLGVLLLQLGFIVPLAARPQQCYDAITPNGNNSSTECGFSGSLIVIGGIVLVTSILVRSAHTHLQIVWDMSPGAGFFWISQAVAWGLTAIVSATELSLSGTSFRFGDFCLVNYHLSKETYWVPLATIIALAIIMNIATFIYCLHIYLRNVQSDRGRNATDASQASQAKEIYNRVMALLALQWRSLLIAFVGGGEIILCCVVFLVLDKQNQAALKDSGDLLPWIKCILSYQDKNRCLSERGKLALNVNALVATLACLGCLGYAYFILTMRVEILTAWWDLLKGLGAGTKKAPVQPSSSRGGSSRSNETSDIEMLSSHQDSPSHDKHLEHGRDGAWE